MINKNDNNKHNNAGNNDNNKYIEHTNKVNISNNY